MEIRILHRQGRKRGDEARLPLWGLIVLRAGGVPQIDLAVPAFGYKSTSPSTAVMG